MTIIRWVVVEETEDSGFRRRMLKIWREDIKMQGQLLYDDMRGRRSQCCEEETKMALIEKKKASNDLIEYELASLFGVDGLLKDKDTFGA